MGQSGKVTSLMWHPLKDKLVKRASLWPTFLEGILSKYFSLDGKIFSFWKVLSKTKDFGKSNQYKYICECVCGNIKELKAQKLLNGHTKSCGCKKIELLLSNDKFYSNKKYAINNNSFLNKFKIGEKVGHLEIKEAIPSSYKKYLCLCVCGSLKEYNFSKYKKNHCGCLRNKTQKRLISRYEKNIIFIKTNLNNKNILFKENHDDKNILCYIKDCTDNKKTRNLCSIHYKKYILNKDFEDTKNKILIKDLPIEKQKEIRRNYQNKFKEKDGNKEKLKLRRKELRLKKENILKERIKASFRRAIKRKSSPNWVDRNKIIEIYNNCPEHYHVDHIIPLSSKNICGLHVPWNLQYLSCNENVKKFNKFDFTYNNEGWRNDC
jgi:hypothetical protein